MSSILVKIQCLVFSKLAPLLNYIAQGQHILFFLTKLKTVTNQPARNSESKKVLISLEQIKESRKGINPWLSTLGANYVGRGLNPTIGSSSGKPHYCLDVPHAISNLG